MSTLTRRLELAARELFGLIPEQRTPSLNDPAVIAAAVRRLRDEHAPYVDPAGEVLCAGDGKSWPCPPLLLLEEA